MRRDNQDRWEAAAARLVGEELVPVARLARLVPTERGSRGHASCWALVRWIRDGKAGVYLDGVRLAGKGWCSSAAALARFAAALARAEAGDRPDPPAPPARGREAARIAGELDALRAGRPG